MKEPERLLRGSGPASELMTGAVLRVPGAARKRALAFTKVAVGMTASSTALAGGGAALVKTWLLTVSLGAAGGGLASLAVTEAYSYLQTNRRAPSAEIAPQQPKLEIAPARAASAVAPEPEPSDAQAANAVQGADSGGEPRPSGGKAKLERRQAASGVASERSGEPVRRSLFEEQRMIESARTAVARGDAESALKALDTYEQSYAERQFGPEALALRVEALVAAGQLPRARLLAKDFELRYPRHPLLSRVQAAVTR